MRYSSAERLPAWTNFLTSASVAASAPLCHRFASSRYTGFIGKPSSAVTAASLSRSVYPGSVFHIRYSNGSSQTLAPFLSATGFFDSLSVRGLAFQLNRQTGVIVMNAGSFRPAFKVSPATAEENAFHQQTKDEEG